MDEGSAYGLWSLVIINSVVFILFAFSFTRPRTTRDWRSLGAFSAFIVALFAEMYGFPLTIYLLSGWLARQYPAVDLFSHETGHLWHTLLGMKGHAHVDPLHIFSEVLIFAVCGLHRDHAGFSPPMANHSDIVHVPRTRGNVCPSRAQRGETGPCGIRRVL